MSVGARGAWSGKCVCGLFRQSLSTFSARRFLQVAPPASTSELVYGIRLPFLVSQTKVDRKVLEKDQGELIEDALLRIKASYEDDPNKRSSTTLNLSFIVNPELIKQNNLLKGTLVLPNAVAENVRVIVFAKDEEAKKAKAAGYEYVGGDDLVQKVLENDVQFERVVATVSMMPVLTKIAKILGPKGLMPSVKAGTLNNDIMAALSTISNAATYVFDKDSLTISAPIALMSLPLPKIIVNVNAAIDYFASLSKASKTEHMIQKVTLACGKKDPIQIKRTELPAIH